MNLLFVKIKDKDGDTDLLNVREITDIQPNRGISGGWKIMLTNSTEYIVCDAVAYRVCCEISRFGKIVDCTGNREHSCKTLDGDNPKKENADSLRNVTFD